MKALVTGSEGFVGKYLRADLLVKLHSGRRDNIRQLQRRISGESLGIERG